MPYNEVMDMIGAFIGAAVANMMTGMFLVACWRLNRDHRDTMAILMAIVPCGMLILFAVAFHDVSSPP